MEFMIETNNLVKSYKEQVVVNHVNLHIRKGSIYGLLGRNGAGKTTIMKMMLGLTNATSGEIFIMGKSLRNHKHEMYARIGVMLDTLSFYPNLTATENLQVFAKLRGTISRNAIRDALEIAGLPFADKKRFAEFSLGMKQRMGFANAIMHDPELLILDEPSNGLDPVGIVEMRKYIKMLSEKRGKTILVSSHILSEIGLLADDIGILHNGELLEESSYAEMQCRNRQYTLLKVSSADAASCVLEQQFHIKDYIVEDENTLRLFDVSHSTAKLNEVLLQNKVSVMGLQTSCESLEDYFKKITGGDNIDSHNFG